MITAEEAHAEMIRLFGIHGDLVARYYASLPALMTTEEGEKLAAMMMADIINDRADAIILEAFMR